MVFARCCVAFITREDISQCHAAHLPVN